MLALLALGFRFRHGLSAAPRDADMAYAYYAAVRCRREAPWLAGLTRDGRVQAAQAALLDVTGTGARGHLARAVDLRDSAAVAAQHGGVDSHVVQWLRAAAAAGDAGAAADLGQAYYTGQYGLARDDARAAGLLRHAAAHGDAGAMVWPAGLTVDRWRQAGLTPAIVPSTPWA